MERKRVLFCTEASPLSSGFGHMSLELVRRFYESGRYDVCELGCYLPYGDGRADELPWRFIGTTPDPQNQREVDAYNADPQNQFGKWKFEEACLEFKPQVVVEFRDNWYMDYQVKSPLRPFYRLAWMPTVDAEPQKEDWVWDMARCDAVLAYTDWAAGVIKRQGRSVNFFGVASPGVDLDTFRVMPDRAAVRAGLGVRPDALVVGFVGRNQTRKLFPGLVRAFRLFLDSAPGGLGERTYLHLHTCWPDVGWDVPGLIKEFGVGSRVYFTYHCKACGNVFAHLWMDSRGHCQACGNHAANFPNSNVGVTRDAMARIYNAWDAYVQYANSEGLGIPAVEAAACGLVPLAVDYSAMGDVVRKLDGVPVRVLALAKELPLECYRAVPDEADLVKKLAQFLSLPEPVRRAHGYRCRKRAEAHFGWDASAGAWMACVDALPAPERGWDAPPSYVTPDLNLPDLPNAEVVNWALAHTAGRPDLANSLAALRMLRDLNWGGRVLRFDGTVKMFPYTRDHLRDECRLMAEHHNHWERRRRG